MRSSGAYGEELVRHFRVGASAHLISDAVAPAPIAVTRIRCDSPGHGLSGRIPTERAFSVVLQLRDSPDRELFLAGRSVHRGGYRARTVSIVDLEEEPTARLESPFDALHFYVPRAALDAIADQRGAKRIGTLRCARGTLDETVWHLGRALLPALERPAEVSAIYADQALLATHLYFATAFGGMRAATPVRAGCLAPWQLRRATEIMLDDLGADLPLSTLAAACRLSSTHFARAFRQTVGEPPHRWLVRQRIERAKLLMRDTRSTLAEIALACGFADQSHFTRSFGAAVGATPRTWRRGIH